MRRLVALAAILLVAAAPACGSSEAEEFREKDLEPAQERLERSRARVAATLRAARPGNRRDARAVGRDATNLRADVSALRSLDPPGDVRDEFEGYVRALDDLVLEMLRLSRSIVRGSPDELASVAAQVQEAAGAVQRGDRALEAALLDAD